MDVIGTRTPAEYGRLLARLLPKGLAWTVAPGSRIESLLTAFGGRLSWVHGRVLQLFEERDYRTTDELLEDWQRIAGLPDPCSENLTTSLERQRQELHAHMTAYGGGSPAYLEEVAANAGYDIEITNPQPFRCGTGKCDEPINGLAWAWAFTITTEATSADAFFRCGSSGCDDPLLDTGDDVLECLIERIKPAHATAHYNYT